MKFVPALTSLQQATKNHLSRLPGPGSLLLQLTGSTVIQETGRMQSRIMQKWVKAKAHQSWCCAIASVLYSQPRSSNVLAYGALWSLSGSFGKVTTNFKVPVSNEGIVWYQPVRAVLLKKVVSEGVCANSSLPSHQCPFPVLWREGLSGAIPVTYHLLCSSKISKGMI